MISVNWVKTRSFSCRLAMVAAISASRANLPLSSLGQGAAAEAVGGVIADLLEPHQGRQHQPAPAHVVARFLEPPLERLHRRLIERRLLAA